MLINKSMKKLFAVKVGCVAHSGGACLKFHHWRGKGRRFMSLNLMLHSKFQTSLGYVERYGGQGDKWIFIDILLNGMRPYALSIHF